MNAWRAMSAIGFRRLCLIVAALVLQTALLSAALPGSDEAPAPTSLAGQSPKEIAIAMDVFGKGADFDVGNDALVRVYIHKLRKALDEFYSSSNAENDQIIHIPRGEYRLRLNPKPAPPPGPV